MRKIVLIDGNGLIFRAYFATERRMTISPDGIPTNAIYLFAQIIMNLLERRNFDDILVALDSPGKKFRHQEYNDYKANRKEVPPALKQQFAPIKEFLNICNIKTIEVDGYEADDVIGTLTKNAKEHDVNIDVYTGDRDLFQLIDDNTNIIMMKTGLSEVEVFDKNHLKEVYNLTPSQVIDIKALMGDSSDNIPGVRGVGPKQAHDLIDKYENLDNVYNNIDNITGKLQEKLIQDKEMAYLSYELATIARDINLDFSLLDETYKEVDNQKLGEFFKRYAMKSLYKFVKQEDNVENALIKVEADENIVTKVSKELLNDRSFIYIDADNDNYHYGNIRGLAIANDEMYEYIPLSFLAFDFDLIDYLANKNIKKNIFDSKKSYVLLKKIGITIQNIGFDFSLASYLISQDYKSIEDIFLRYGLIIDGLARNANSSECTIYSLKIAISCYKLKDVLVNKLKEIDNEKLLYEIEQPLAIILAIMEQNGVLIDAKLLTKLNEEYTSRINAIQDSINDMVGFDFNINSPKQLAELLYDRLGLPSNKKRSTSADDLKRISNLHPIVNQILEYRKYTKLLNTYIDSFESFKFDDNRIHAIFNQSITTTGRLSSSQPNLQNLSVKDEERSIIRKLVIAPKGYKILSLDYSQIELRILAILADDENLIDAFNHNYDIHSATAAKIFNVPLENVTPMQRRIAKSTNFGIVYGISTWGLAEQIDMSLQESKEIIDKFFKTYPKIKEYLDNQVAFLEKNGYVKTLYNRRRVVPEIRSSNYNIREFAHRVAMNTPIQGSAADVIKIAMIKVFDYIKQYGDDCRLISQIHDELLFEIKDELVEKLSLDIKDIMENVLDGAKVKLKVSYAYGDNWLEAK